MIICHIITRMIRGGADENTLLSCNAQIEAGHAVHLICGPEYHQDMIDRLSNEVHFYCATNLVRNISPTKDLYALYELYKILKSISPQVVHTHTSKAGIVGRLAAYFSGVNIIIHGVHILPFLNVGKFEKLTYLILERSIASITHAFIDVSEGMKQMCLVYKVGTPEKHVVIPSGMDVTVFMKANPVDSEVIAKLLPNDLVPDSLDIVVMVAALESRKRIYEFLPVFKKVLAKSPHARLFILGEGNDRSRLLERIRELDLVDYVKLLGYRDDVGSWIKSARVCVLASEREGLPRVAVQYALGGCPAVVTELPGVDAIIKDGLTGYLVPGNDLNSMADKITILLNDSSLNLEMRENIMQLDLSSWSVAHMVTELERIYSDMLSMHVRA